MSDFDIGQMEMLHEIVPTPPLLVTVDFNALIDTFDVEAAFKIVCDLKAALS